MNAWYFVGSGNYSDDYGWFSGLNASVNHQVNLDDIYFEPDTTYDEWFKVEQHLNLDPGKVVFTSVNVYGGSIDIDGIILANTKEEAESLVKEYALEFEN